MTLPFESLPPSTYELTVLPSIQSELGARLLEAVSTQFEVLADVTADLQIVFSQTRANRADQTVSFDVNIRNATDLMLGSPLLILEGLAEPLQLLHSDGVTEDGRPYMRLTAAGAGLAPGGSRGFSP